ncbi:MAG: oxetanocin [Phototrophicales bacterium]|nr:MAG: oxetanocin [Phototrophicales bacterium]
MDAKSLLQFMEQVGRMKVMPRTGWLLRGVKHPETVAEHSYRMTLLAMVLSDMLNEQGLVINVERVMRMALLHDIAESQTGDIPQPAMRHFPDEVKENVERGIMTELTQDFGHLGNLYVDLWEEYERSETLEAQIVKTADKLELLIQAFEYEKLGFQSLDDFWENLLSYPLFQDYPLVQQVLILLAERRLRLPFRHQ